MATRYENVSALTAATIDGLTDNMTSWRSFLKSAAWLYKYPWHEQVMIYAQRPYARAVATMELWNGRRLQRWINRGSKSIALIDDTSDIPKLKYVFDVSDTHPLDRNAPPFALWNVSEEQEAQVIEELTDHFGGIEEYEGLPFSDQVMGIIHNAVTDNYLDYYRDLYDVTEGSFLEELDDFNLEVQLQRALEVSVGYMVLTRLGYDAED